MDLIDRQAAIDECYPVTVDGEVYEVVQVETLIGLPSAQPERKSGRWEMKPDPYGFFEEIPVCSECGCTTKWREKYLYCPNCGARMEGEGNG